MAENIPPQPAAEANSETLPPESQAVEAAPTSAASNNTDEMGALLALKSIDILAMAFSDIPYSQDFFEKALIVLYERRWRFFGIFFYHFFIVGPLFWPSHSRSPRQITFKDYLKRLPLLFFVPVLILSVLYFILDQYDYNFLFPTLAAVLLSSLFIVYFIGTFDDFRRWTLAHVKMNDFFIKKYKKKKITTKKTKKNAKK